MLKRDILRQSDCAVGIDDHGERGDVICSVVERTRNGGCIGLYQSDREVAIRCGQAACSVDDRQRKDCAAIAIRVTESISSRTLAPWSRKYSAIAVAAKPARSLKGGD